ncbi:MAG: Spy/CpxP family protein refolding chaperone, partial [Phenylobacterium sp.]|nr:Spy/CpxP family protein refolding chaperone [Phenylobacterium sp.]
MSPIRHIALAAAAVGLIATTAVAQPAPGAAPGARSAPSAEMQARRDAARKQRTDDLRAILRLRPDQEPALAAYLAAQAPQRRGPGMTARPEPGAAPLTTPQRLDRMAQRTAEMNRRHDARRKAVETFYAALAPDQQRAFDALQRLQGPKAGG